MLIDSHCHIPHKKYNKSLAQLIKEANYEGVERLITIGSDIKENEIAIKAAAENEGVYAVVGIYPNSERKKETEEIMGKLEEQAKSSPKIVGIGECGYDITARQQQRPADKQVDLFEQQIELALKLELPIVVHNRNGDELLLKSLTKYKERGLKGVSHCFTSSWEFAKKLLDLDFYLSFTAIVTYPTGKGIWETVEKMPLDRILVETDAPYLPPQDMRGQVNEPKYVRITAKTLAEIKKISFEKLSEATYNNSCRLFSKMAQQ